MAVVTESANEMTDADVSAGTEVRFVVLSPNDPMVQALPPAIPANPTLAERLFVRTKIIIQRSDGLDGGSRWSEWKNAGVAGYPAMTPSALRGELKIIHDADRAELV